ncbi:MAG: hypothetical protein KAH97_09075 [Anaerolineales bacterium]|nr:hypothetical protein [Anaerolineales bacterium]
MIVKGLIIAASGFLFIFAPGVPMGLIYQKYRTPAKSLLVTGIIVWIITVVLAIFVQAMIRPILPENLNIIDPGNALEYALSLLGPIIAALFLATGLYIVLRREKKRTSFAIFSVLTLGFGAGLINQVFNGLNLVGSGFRLALGAATGTDLGEFAEVEFLDLIFVLLALIVFRIALLIVTALVGVMVDRAVSGEKKFFWQAVILSALFNWIVIVIFLRMGDSPGQLIVGQANPITSIIAILFCAFASILSYQLLTKHFEPLRS